MPIEYILEYLGLGILIQNLQAFEIMIYSQCLETKITQVLSRIIPNHTLRYLQCWLKSFQCSAIGSTDSWAVIVCYTITRQESAQGCVSTRMTLPLALLLYQCALIHSFFRLPCNANLIELGHHLKTRTTQGYFLKRIQMGFIYIVYRQFLKLQFKLDLVQVTSRMII